MGPKHTPCSTLTSFPDDPQAGEQFPPPPSSPPERNLPNESMSIIDITRDIEFDAEQSLKGLEAHMGGFGDVFIGTHASRGKVALKRPRLIGRDASTVNSLRRLEIEAVTWSQLSHENVLPFLGVFKRNEQTYLVSPWIAGGHIRGVVERDPGVDRFSMITGIASGLSYLHSMGVVHGDLRALNILYSDEGHPQICDFGLYKVLETMQVSTPMKGTGSSQWLAPEVWKGEPKTEKSDVYAFGITISEVLSGAPPLAGMSYGALYDYVCMAGKRPPKVPAQSVGGISYAPLWEIAERCWAAASDVRPSMSEVHRMLLELRDKQVVAVGSSWAWFRGIRYFLRLFSGR